MLYLPLILPFNQLYITNDMECFSFKSGRAVHVVKLTKVNWLVVRWNEMPSQVSHGNLELLTAPQ